MTICDSEKEMLEHLGYEWWMFQSTWSALSTLPHEADFVRNALLESLVIHARGMIEFYYFDRANTPRPDDWTVDKLRHGLSRQSMPADVRTWKMEADKRIAHMTVHRGKPLAEWNVELIARHLKAKLKNVKQTFGNDFPADWSGDDPRASSLLKQAVSSDTSRAATLGPTKPASPHKSLDF